MVEEVKQIQEEVKKEDESVEKKNTERTLKIFAVVIGAFLLLALVIIKLANPDFNLLLVIIIGLVIIAVSALIYFSFSIFRNLNKDKEDQEDKLPKPLSLASLRKMSEEALVNEFYGNHIKGCLGEKFYNIGKTKKSRIYLYKAEALYKDEMKKGVVYILINAHFPEDLKTILIDPTDVELRKSINALSLEPEDEEEVEETTTYNPLTGTEQVKRKVGRPTKEEAKKRKEGDLE